MSFETGTTQPAVITVPAMSNLLDIPDRFFPLLQQVTFVLLQNFMFPQPYFHVF